MYKHKAIRVIILLYCTIFVGCGDMMQSPTPSSNDADKLMEAAHQERNYEGLLQMSDSLEAAGQLSEAKAYYWRGYACDRMNQKRTAQFYLKKALASVHDFSNESEVRIYTKAASRLANLLNMKGDYESSLKMAMAAVEKIEAIHADTTSDYANLLIFLGCCQSRFGQTEAATESNYNRAYEKHLESLGRNHTDEAYKNAIAGVQNIVFYSINVERYTEALTWVERLDTLLSDYETLPETNAEYIDKQRARYYIYKASSLEGTGRHEQATQAYEKFKQTNFSHESEGMFLAGDYLLTAKQWQEAADCYQRLDDVVWRHHVENSLENIQTVFLKKYYANLGAGRMDTVLAVSMLICDSLDEAINRSKLDDAAELATIYDTQQKEAQLAEQQAKQERMRQVNIIAIITLIAIVIAVLTVNRHLHARKMEKKNKLLQEANARAEVASKMKTNFIQQISHEIRTPLNILSGFTQVLTTPGLELDEESKRDANQQIKENTERITKLVNKMLELSDTHSDSVLECNDTAMVIAITAKAIDTSRIGNASHLNFDLYIAPEAEDVELHTNKKAATRALTLLLDNARKFTKPAEAIQDNSTEKKDAKLSIDIQDKYVRFIIEDTGIGVPPAEAEHIFEEFVQLNDYYDGTGIGLTVARSLVRRMGGDVVLDTSYHNGARFVMTLPLEAKQHEE